MPSKLKRSTTTAAIRKQHSAATHEVMADQYEAAGSHDMARSERDNAAYKAGEAEKMVMLDPSAYQPVAGGEYLARGDMDATGRRQIAILSDAAQPPKMIAVQASMDRMELSEKTGSLEMALDAAESIGATNSIEMMLVQEVSALHKTVMHLIAKATESMNGAAFSPGVEQAQTDVACKLFATVSKLLTANAGLVNALAKLRTGGKQLYVHQHVHVSGDGQTLVTGNLNGGVGKNQAGAMP